MEQSKDHTQRTVEDLEFAERDLDLETPDGPAALIENVSQEQPMDQTVSNLSAGNKAIDGSGTAVRTAARSDQDEEVTAKALEFFFKVMELEDSSLLLLDHHESYDALVSVMEIIIAELTQLATSGDGGHRVPGDPSLPACFVTAVFPANKNELPISEFLVLMRACKIYIETLWFQEETEMQDQHALRIAKVTKTKFIHSAFRYFPDLPKELRNEIWGLAFTAKPAEVVVIQVCSNNSSTTPGHYFRVQSLTPQMINTCYESRAEILGRYSKDIMGLWCQKRNSYAVFNKHDKVVFRGMHDLASKDTGVIMDYFTMTRKNGSTEYLFSELRELAVEQSFFALPINDIGPMLEKQWKIFPALTKIAIYNRLEDRIMDFLIGDKKALKMFANRYSDLSSREKVKLAILRDFLDEIRSSHRRREMDLIEMGSGKRPRNRTVGIEYQYFSY